jgi:hypothetical protein
VNSSELNVIKHLKFNNNNKLGAVETGNWKVETEDEAQPSPQGTSRQPKHRDCIVTAKAVDSRGTPAGGSRGTGTARPLRGAARGASVARLTA